MLFFYVFSTEHAISFVNRKGTLPHLICEAFVHPGSRWVCLSSVLSLSCASAIIACTTVDFFVFLPIFSTSHEPFKAQGLTCLLPPWCLTLCLAQVAWMNDLWILLGQRKVPNEDSSKLRRGKNSLFGRESPPEYKLEYPVKYRHHSS